MLRRSHKLSVEQFNTVMEKGRVAHSPLFLVRIARDQSDTRIAAVGPVKFLKTAVSRNRVRRKIYEAVRIFKGGMIHGVHVIIIAKPTILQSTQAEISADIKDLFVKSKLLS